jgi:hypothetical protein
MFPCVPVGSQQKAGQQQEEDDPERRAFKEELEKLAADLEKVGRTAGKKLLTTCMRTHIPTHARMRTHNIQTHARTQTHNTYAHKHTKNTYAHTRAHTHTHLNAHTNCRRNWRSGQTQWPRSVMPLLLQRSRSTAAAAGRLRQKRRMGHTRRLMGWVVCCVLTDYDDMHIPISDDMHVPNHYIL